MSARGLLLGLATGDVRGAPYEGAGAWRLAGLHTDDTQQAWAIAEAMQATGGVDPDAIAERFAAMVVPRPGLPDGFQRGSGRTFRAAARALANGAGWRSSGIVSPSNGAAMRVAVVAIGATSLFEGVDRALVSGAITHRSALALEPAAALAGLAWKLLRDRPPRSEWLAIAREGAARATARLIASFPLEVDLAGSGQFAHLLDRPVERPTAYAPTSVAAAIRFAAEARDYASAVQACIDAGGDTDTTAAMAGALCGAAGDEIPAEWLAQVRARDALEALAQGLSVEQAPLEVAWSLEELSGRGSGTASRPTR